MVDNKFQCECRHCKFSRETQQHLDLIKNDYPETHQFLKDIVNDLFEIGQELDVYYIYIENLRNAYPEVARKVMTLEKIIKSDSVESIYQERNK